MCLVFLCLLPIQWISANTYHLFVSNIQRTYALPVGRTVWPLIKRPFLLASPSVISFGVAKVRRFFLKARKSKIFLNFLFLFSYNLPPVEAGCKCSNLFWFLSSAREIFFSILFDSNFIPFPSEAGCKYTRRSSTYKDLFCFFTVFFYRIIDKRLVVYSLSAY